MATKTAKTNRPAKSVSRLESTLNKLAQHSLKSVHIKRGQIAIRATGEGGGTFFLAASARGVNVTQAISGASPKIEIIGDATRLTGILSGEKDARKQFLAGGFRIRGDIRYLSDLALELGFLREPL